MTPIRPWCHPPGGWAPAAAPSQRGGATGKDRAIFGATKTEKV